ncbi:hypothetical protein JNUCC64_20295 [Streptomyces sp. JNUCC 64]
MTDLFTVSVDGVEGAVLRGRIHLVSADAVRVPRDHAFPVALLAEAWFRLAGDGPGEPGADARPTGRRPDPDAVADLRLAPELRDLHGCLAGRLVRVSDDGYLLDGDGVTVREPRRRAADVYDLGGSGRDGVSAYVRTLSDSDELARRAAEIVVGYEVGPLRNVPVWREVAAVDPEEWEPGLEEMATWDAPADLDYWRTWRLLDGRPLEDHPYAEITVKVSDAGYLEHLVPGTRWSTAGTGATAV